MAKIGIGNFRWEQHYGDYDIMYSSKDQTFYTDASKLFAGAGEFFDSINGSDNKVEGLNLHKINYGHNAGMKQIYASSQKALENSVNLFNKLFVTTETTEEKVILYTFNYDTETGKNDGYHRYNQGSSEIFSMEFRYYIASKKILGENKLYIDISTRSRIDRYDVAKFKEIAWSQELEDFIKSFSKSFDGLVNKMRPFFEEEGKIIELIGKNILMP